MNPRSLRIPLFLLVALAVCALPAPEADLIIHNCRLLVGDGKVIEGATVVLYGGLIRAAGLEAGRWRGIEEIDAAGRTVMPGLIDSHVHLLALAAESAETVARYRRDRLPAVLREFLERGITTIRSTGDPLPAIAEIRDQLRSGVLEGPRLLISGPVLTARDGHPAATICARGTWAWCRENLARELDDAETARQAVAELAEQDVDFIKVVYENRLGAKLDRVALEAIVDEAKVRGLQVVAHAVPGELAVEAIEEGIGGLVHFPVRGSTDSQKLVRELGGLAVSSTLGLLFPVADQQGDLRSPYGSRWNERREEARVAMSKAATVLWQAGAPLALGTDTPMFSPAESWNHEVQALLYAGLTPADVLLTATKNAAGALQLERELGSVEPGKRADLVMVDGRPDIDLEALGQIVLVFKDGRAVVDLR